MLSRLVRTTLSRPRLSLRGGAVKLRSLAPLVAASQRSFLTWSTSHSLLDNWTSNETLKAWVLDRIQLMNPSWVHLCDGTEEENELLLRRMVHSGMMVRLNDKLRPNSYLARSTATDVARVEERTYICSDSDVDAGPTNIWKDPEEMTTQMQELFDGCMRGRTMYVIPFCMGPLNSDFSQIGIQITDSPYVVASMRIMTRMGKSALDMLGDSSKFVPCVHSVGAPLGTNVLDTPWPENPEDKYIVHFPEQRRIWSYGSGYGGNALLGKKCLALRIASAMARDEGWLAEHMLIVGITNPAGVKKYFAAAFPSACGKTNLAMMNPRLPGWKVECVGDDIAWMRIGEDGRLWAVNPEAGFFGVAPGTSYDSNPNAMETINSNTIFTNVAMTEEGDVWWEDMTEDKPNYLTSWKRSDWSPEMSRMAAHPNARFTVPASQCPVIDDEWENPKGVPISGIIFGGRRSSTVPLVYEARDWEHGVYVGATMNSETTAAAAGTRGVLRADPFAMKPFCGYNMGDYFSHWLSFVERVDGDRTKLPGVFHVNWFRKSAEGKFLWPGFGENIRVLEWIFNRSAGNEGDASEYDPGVETAIGVIPSPGKLNTEGLNLSQEDMDAVFKIDKNEWVAETNRNLQFLRQFNDRLPEEMEVQGTRLRERLEQKA